MDAPLTSTGPDLQTLLDQLDLPDKIALLSGAGMWTTQPSGAVGLRAMTLSDGPVGVRGGHDTELDASAAFPSGSAMAASWDEDLTHRIGQALAAEASRKHVDVVLGPTVNLHRSPLAGRNFECLSEDPLLTARLATAYVRGVQGGGVGACPKHYVANDAETDRTSVEVVLDERTLRELYLAPFEAVVTDARPWMVMAAYNGVNGAAMTASDLLAEPLKGQWGFDGVVVSDWDALRDGEAAARGALDLAMPGPDARWGAALAEAVRAGRVSEADVDAKVRRLLRLAWRAGALAGHAAPVPAVAPGRLADAVPLARQAAVAGMVLLRNDGVLPLRAGDLRRVAVLGPGARDARALGGGSASVPLPHVVTPVAGLHAAFADCAPDGPAPTVVSAVGAVLSRELRPARPDELAGPGGTAVRLRWLDEHGSLIAERDIGSAVLVTTPAAAPPGAVALELETSFTPDTDGHWRLGAAGFGACELHVDGARAAHGTVVQEVLDIAEIFGSPPQHTTTVALRAGRSVAVRVRCRWPQEAFLFRAAFVVGQPAGSDDDELARAVETARGADVAVVVVGTSETVESEGFDRTSLALPGRQDDLVRAVAAVNPRTVVVVNAGAPVTMPWRDDVAAVLLVWFPGMELGSALADVLLGAAEPGGRLPTTWPARLQDAPVLSTTPVDGRLEYTEGLDIGYRAYLRSPVEGSGVEGSGVEGSGVEPAYWFGSGLGYTTWEHEAITAPARADGTGDLVATVRIRNTGARPGKAVVQVYAARPGSTLPRPVRVLAGFTVAHAGPGQVLDVAVTVSARTLRHWDTAAGAWAVEPGALELSTGPHAGDQPLRTTVQLAADDGQREPVAP